MPLLERLRRWTDACPSSVAFLAFAFLLVFAVQACAPGATHGGDMSIVHWTPASIVPARLGSDGNERAGDDPCCLAVPGLTHEPNALLAIATDGELRLPSADAVAVDVWPRWRRAHHPWQPARDGAGSERNGAHLYLTTLRLRI